MAPPLRLPQVRETLLFAARLRLPRAVPLAQKEALVEGLLHKLNLAKVADTVVGGPKARDFLPAKRPSSAWAHPVDQYYSRRDKKLGGSLYIVIPLHYLWCTSTRAVVVFEYTHARWCWCWC